MEKKKRLSQSTLCKPKRKKIRTSDCSNKLELCFSTTSSVVLFMSRSFSSILRLNEFGSILEVSATSQKLRRRKNVSAKVHYANQKEKSEEVIVQTNWTYVFQQPVQWFYSCRHHELCCIWEALTFAIVGSLWLILIESDPKYLNLYSWIESNL